MHYLDKERIISLISWGNIPTKYDHFNLILKTPTPKIRSKASYVYWTAYSHCVNNNLLNNRDLLDYYTDLGKWSIDKENKIIEINDKIHDIKKRLIDFRFKKTSLIKAKEAIKLLEKELSKINFEKGRLLINSAENFALTKEQQYIIYKITYNKKNKRFWPNQEVFNNFTDLQLINYLCNEFFNNTIINVKQIREIARSHPWRYIWEGSKTNNNLFGKSPDMWSDYQKLLVYWSTMYDSVYGSYHRPPSDVIEDDDLLDSWFIRESDKSDHNANKNFMEGKVKSGRKDGKQENFIFTDKDGAQKVYNMNDPISKATLKARNKKIKERGKIGDQYLPDSQSMMRNQLMEMRNSKIRNK